MKKWLKSKTLWMNMLAVILLLLEAKFEVAPAELNPTTQAIILAILNWFLRWKTDTKIVVK